MPDVSQAAVDIKQGDEPVYSSHFDLKEEAVVIRPKQSFLRSGPISCPRGLSHLALGLRCQLSFRKAHLVDPPIVAGNLSCPRRPDSSCRLGTVLQPLRRKK